MTPNFLQLPDQDPWAAQLMHSVLPLSWGDRQLSLSSRPWGKGSPRTRHSVSDMWPFYERSAAGPALLTGEVHQWSPSVAQLIPLFPRYRVNKYAIEQQRVRLKVLRAQPCPAPRKKRRAQCPADEGSLVMSSHTETTHVQSEGRPPSPSALLQTVCACTIHLRGMCEGGGAGWVMGNIKKYSWNRELQLQMALNQHQASSAVSVWSL